MSAARATAAVVTIDGPAGSGKTTLGRRVAAALGLPLVDTGLFYRAVAVAAHRAGMDAADAAGLERLAASLDIEVNTDPEAPAGAWQLRLGGEDVTAEARDPRLATLLARISGVAGVRAAVLARQRGLAEGGAVAVGRDCGTVVFPAAAVKIYLEAGEEVRARRRAAEIREGGGAVDEGILRSEIAGRDALDTGRAVAPLRPAADAHVIDTGRVGVEGMVESALRLCRASGLAPAGQRPG